MTSRLKKHSRTYLVLAICTPLVLLAALALMWLDKAKSPFVEVEAADWREPKRLLDGRDPLGSMLADRSPPASIDRDAGSWRGAPPSQAGTHLLPVVDVVGGNARTLLYAPLRDCYRGPYSRSLRGEWAIEAPPAGAYTIPVSVADEPLDLDRRLVRPDYEVVEKLYQDNELERIQSLTGESDNQRRVLGFLGSNAARVGQLRKVLPPAGANETPEELLQRLQRAKVFLQALPPKDEIATVRFRALSWQSPLFLLPVEVPRSTNTVEVTVSSPSAVTVWQLAPTPESQPQIVKRGRKELVDHSGEVEAMEKMFGSLSETREMPFYFYSRVLGLSNMDPERQPDHRQKLLAFVRWLSAPKVDDKPVEGGTKKLLEDIESALRTKSTTRSYDFTYSYCYFVMCCLEAHELVKKAQGFERRQEFRALSQALAEIVLRSSAVLSNAIAADGSVGALERPGARPDRSIAVLVAYTLWKVSAALGSGSQLTADLDAQAPRTASNLLQEVDLKREALVGYVCDGSTFRTPEGRLGIAYQNETWPNRHLFGGYLMSLLSVSKRRNDLLESRDRLQELLTRQQTEWAKESSTSDWHFWYELTYFARALEILASDNDALGVGIGDVVQPLVDAVNQRLAPGKYAELTDDYCKNYYYLSLDTMVRAKDLLR